MEWFNKNDIKIHHLLRDPFSNNIKGYVLPHAGTKYSGEILSHTLRFFPINYFTTIVIIYYPANSSENVIISETEKYYHEYYVIMKTLDYVCKKYWNYGNKNFVGINLLKNVDGAHLTNLDNCLLIVSADYSHFLPMQEAIKLENCAAHALMHKYFPSHLKCIDVIDDVKSFKLMYDYLPTDYNLQWIGRTRSPNLHGVGYLSFLIKKPQKPENFRLPHGMFVTAYDINMVQRECLGEWFTKSYSYNKTIEQNLISKVLSLAKTTSRLTGGNHTNISVSHYTITYLYRSSRKKFIRGYHGIKSDAFYLPDVMLENTYDNGLWIQNYDSFWKQGKVFNIKYTLNNLKSKAKLYTKKTLKLKTFNKYNPYYTLYYSDVIHHKI